MYVLCIGSHIHFKFRTASYRYVSWPKHSISVLVLRSVISTHLKCDRFNVYVQTWATCSNSKLIWPVINPRLSGCKPSHTKTATISYCTPFRPLITDSTKKPWVYKTLCSQSYGQKKQTCRNVGIWSSGKFNWCPVKCHESLDTAHCCIILFFDLRQVWLSEATRYTFPRSSKSCNTCQAHTSVISEADFVAMITEAIISLILRRSRTGTVRFYTSTSNKRAARPKLYTKSLTWDLKLMYSRLTLMRISIKL